ncbi:MAG: hypothetical protein ACRC9Y_16185 [Aeromonas veronii]
MKPLIKDAKIKLLGRAILSPVIYTGKTKRTSVQMSVNSEVGEQSSAKAFIQVSNNNIDWFNLGVLETTGTGPQKDGGPYEALWEYTRILLESTPTEGKARVNIYVSTRDSR